mmetsp:Transcript_44974/g.57578  ORF Transcript_44974/g.57578 Transcript_44974/m.57578 type:complete len:121 (+) Transcript_44974:478-840(+)
MDGEGTYTYSKTKDVYSGAWTAGIKNGKGCYEYGGDKSKLNGVWEQGSFVSGDWVLDGAGVYKGSFANGKPSGPGEFTFANGVVQTGEYASPPAGEDDDEDTPPADPSWAGTPIYSTVAS